VRTGHEAMTLEDMEVIKKEKYFDPRGILLMEHDGKVVGSIWGEMIDRKNHFPLNALDGRRVIMR